MEIGKRLYELRAVKGLTQGAIGKQIGVTRTRISQVENGHVAPSLAVLERWAKVLDVEFYKLFFVGDGKPEARSLPEHIPLRPQERSLLLLFRQLGSDDRSLLLSMACDMVRRGGKHE
jgi:transcriptional regulator with XRE-family HTH domain